MKVGEIWNDKTDGSKVKIWLIKYKERDSDHTIYYKDFPDEHSGSNLPRKFFLEAFEKCED